MRKSIYVDNVKELLLRFVATHFEKITHFEKFFQSALNLGPNQHTLKKIFKVR